MPIISEKQENQKQVLTLNDLEKRKVVEHNSLITSIAKQVSKRAILNETWLSTLKQPLRAIYRPLPCKI